MSREGTSPEACVEAVIAKVGTDIRIATPLAAGKPNHLLNAFYQRAKSDLDIRLTIMTALTLERPKGKSELEKRFLQPIVERSYGNYPDLDYELDRVAERLPENVRILEFYFSPAKYLHNYQAQRDHVCSNFTHVVRDVLDRGVNVLAQQVASDEIDGQSMFSLSCNADLTIDLMAGMRRSESKGQSIAFVAQTNDELPFMYGDALIKPDSFHFIVRNPDLNYTVYGIPKMSVSDADFTAGIYCSALVKDGGELQVGIGSLGDAVVHGLLLRHENNKVYAEILQALELRSKFPIVAERIGDDKPFVKGLFAASEMIVDGFLQLYKRGVIKRHVYDDIHLQRLLNEEIIDERVTPATLDALLERGAIGPRLSNGDIDYLKYYGVFNSAVGWNEGKIVTPEGERISADLTNTNSRARLLNCCLGDRLQHGAVMHGGFFLGSQLFYKALRAMSSDERKLIRMRSVARINQLLGHEKIDRLHRRDARFINTCMMITLSGAAVSDGLESGAVLSGVGGQFNFVDMAQALPDGHSALNLRATRISKGRVVSNIVWNYGHITIPRHLRDIYVTEYGVANVRGKTDEEVIREILNITDSRFQAALKSRAIAEGKLDPNYQIPECFQTNTPERIAAQLAPFKVAGHFPAFPFECEFTPHELQLGKALRTLKRQTQSTTGLVRAIARAVFRGGSTPEIDPLLIRMKLIAPSSVKEHLYRRLLCAQLRD